MKKIKYVCIFSLRWSGSTIFNILLGQHKDIVSVGEVNVAFKHMITEKLCSCGKPAKECDYWKHVFQRLQHIPKDMMGNDIKYETAIKSFREVYGENMVLCDSGKDPRAILRLADNPDVDLYVIFLSKDIRGFVQSNLSKIEHKNSIIYGFKYTKTLFFHSLYWLLFNHKHFSAFRRKNIRIIKVGYEELCLNTNLILSRTFDFLGLEVMFLNSKFDTTKNHLLWGHALRYDPSLNLSLQYDFSWFINPWLNLVSWPLQFFNKRYVYSNTQFGERGRIKRVV
jgi:hypothetical protein